MVYVLAHWTPMAPMVTHHLKTYDAKKMLISNTCQTSLCAMGAAATGEKASLSSDSVVDSTQKEYRYESIKLTSWSVT